MGARILVVDDDGALVHLISRHAEAAGLATIHLSDGARVLDVASDQQPDLILLDIGLPHTDGRDVLKSLKAHASTYQIPVFVHTGRADHTDRIAALGLGADDYFEKPFDIALLTRRILHRLSKQASTPSPPNEVDRRSSEKLRVARQERLSQGRIPVASSRPHHPVLVVEDDNDVRRCICEILEDEGIDAWPARSGHEALELLRKHALRPSVILLDLAMPDMDGVEFQKQLTHDATFPPARLVIMSDVGPDSTLASSHWLQKPIDLNALLSAVSDA